MGREGIFTIGGTVQAAGGRYIPRPVDDELLALCRDGAFAFVLTARQMGKSSLMVRTAQRLAEEGVRSVIVDLTQIGVQLDADAWYLGLLTAVSDHLDLDTDVFEWWTAHAHQGYTQRLTLFFRDVLLVEVRGRVVIFIDEIDSTLSLPFTDDFFAAVRFVYNARSVEPAFNRLSFVLIGVASPIDLITDSRRTPFNIGQEVDVDYFTVDEALPLSEGFDLPPDEARRTLRDVVEWTGGHPYLTQRLCYVIADRIRRNEVPVDVDRAVADTFFGDKSEQDSNLRFVHDMLTRRASDPMAVLSSYRMILQGRQIPDDKQSPVITHLKLSGVVGRRDGRLTIRNPIYASVFSAAWVKQQWPEAWYRRVPPAVLGLAAALFAAVILLGLFLLQTQKAYQADEQRLLQAALNARLSDQVTMSDSLRSQAESALAELSNQIRVVDSLRAAEATANDLLSEQIRVAESLNARLNSQMLVADSLRRIEAAANVQLSDQVEMTDSMRLLAEDRLREANEAALETLTIALASKALRQLKLGNAELGALLARQAHVFSRQGEGEFLDPVYDALLQSLNALADNGAASAGGPEVMAHHSGGVRAVAFSPDDRWMATAGEDGSVVLVTTATGTTHSLESHRASVRALAFTSDGSMLASGSDDGTVRIWTDLASETPRSDAIRQHNRSIWTLAFSPDGRYLASAGKEHVILVQDLSGTDPDRSLRLPNDASIRSVSFSPNGRALAAGSEDGQMHLWNWREHPTRPQSRRATTGRLLSIAFHPSGRLLALGGDDPDVLIWRVSPDGPEPEPERRLRGHEGPVNVLAFSPDGSMLASGSADFSVQLWDMGARDRSPIILQDHASWVWSVAFSPDGMKLASGSQDRTVRIWDVRPDHLAEKICDALGGRELSGEEWRQYVGVDVVYADYYVSCEQAAASRPFVGGEDATAAPGMANVDQRGSNR